MKARADAGLPAGDVPSQALVLPAPAAPDNSVDKAPSELLPQTGSTLQLDSCPPELAVTEMQTLPKGGKGKGSGLPAVPKPAEALQSVSLQSLPPAEKSPTSSLPPAQQSPTSSLPPAQQSPTSSLQAAQQSPTASLQAAQQSPTFTSSPTPTERSCDLSAAQQAYNPDAYEMPPKPPADLSEGAIYKRLCRLLQTTRRRKLLRA